MINANFSGAGFVSRDYSVGTNYHKSEKSFRLATWPFSGHLSRDCPLAGGSDVHKVNIITWSVQTLHLTCRRGEYQTARRTCRDYLCVVLIHLAMGRLGSRDTVQNHAWTWGFFFFLPDRISDQTRYKWRQWWSKSHIQSVLIKEI